MQDAVNQPGVAEAVRLVSGAVAAADYERAHELAETALAQGAIHPALFSARALWLERQKRDEDALADFEQAASLSPGDVLLFNAIGLCLVRLYRLDEAVATFDHAIRLKPTYTASYHRKGTALAMAGDVAGAQRAYEQGIRLNPQDAEALAGLAALVARQGNTKALDYADRALRLAPRHTTAITAKALLANAQGRFAEAENLVRPLVERSGLLGQARAVALGILADSLDGQERIAEAYEMYSSENDELRRLHSPRFSGLRSTTDFVRDLLAQFQSIPGELLSNERPTRDEVRSPPTHVFLLGFFRSGTTLLNQVLACHPGIVTLEEHDFLLEPARNFLSDPAGLARLATLTPDDLEEQRAAYWKKAADHGLDLKGRIFVDKQPLNTIKLPLIAKLFPEARILFALRDPRDVVLSCFRTHFEINAAMFDLLTLEGAATFYDLAMQFAWATEPLFAQPFLVHRHEDMISDFDASLNSLCDALGVAFSPTMHDFAAAARRNDIRSPSRSQVARGLYSTGIGQWRRYRDRLAPVLPLLHPWVERFGYPAD